MFAISAIFPIVSLAAGCFVVEKEQVEKQEAKQFLGDARMNAKIVWKYLRLSFIFKPLVLILLVIIAPSVDNAMFYYNSSVLKFNDTEFANINVIS